MIGLIGPLLGGGGGGGFGTGFSLISSLVGGLLGGNQFPGYGDDLTHPGYGDAGEDYLNSQNLQADLSAYGSYNSYFGNAAQFGGYYGAQQQYGYGAPTQAYPQYQVAPPTYSNAYFGQAGYTFGSHGVQYAAPPAQPAPQPQTPPDTDARKVVVQIKISGDLGKYHDKFTLHFGSQQQQPYGFVDPYGSTMNYTTQVPSYGQAIAPQHSYYFGGQQFYSQASTLYAHQTGAAAWLNFPPIQVVQYPQGAGYGSPAPPAPPVNGPAKVYPKVPHVNNHGEWLAASKVVGERLVGGDGHSRAVVTFGGQDPRTNSDGWGNERMAVWHVFQNNADLRYNMDNGYFFRTGTDGQVSNAFHISQVAALERMANGDFRLGAQNVNSFLAQMSGLPQVAAQPLVSPQPAPVVIVPPGLSVVGISQNPGPGGSTTGQGGGRGGRSFG